MKVKNKAQVVVATNDSLLLLKLIPKRGHFWQNITGGVDKGEEVFEGAKRELEEESGFTLKDGQLFDLKHSFSFEGRRGPCTEYVFLFLLDKIKNPTLDGKEHESFKWVKIKEVTKDCYKYDSNWEAFQKAYDFILNLD